jgi:hypothetical protein
MQTKFSLIFAVMLVASGSIRAQEVKRPPLQVPSSADSAAQLVPSGWRLETDKVREADLNNDGRPDAAFVISNGGTSEDPAVVKHVLLLALRGDDGKLHRSMVNDAAVLDGDEGGSFGDPFEDLTIERGAVVITHYGGSRERWGFTHRYRFDNGQWKLIGLTIRYMDSTNPEHYDDQDINLSTGLVRAEKKGGDDGEPQKPLSAGSYYELEAMRVDRAPKLDGQIATDEWPGYSVRLNQALQVVRNRVLWKSADDLSARLHAVWVGANLFLSAEVTDNEVTAGDTVRLVNKRGVVIKPRESKITPQPKGYVIEARYLLKDVAIALKAQEKYIVENLDMVFDPSIGYGDTQGFQLPASIEVIDVDKAGPRAVLSTRSPGSPYSGAIRIFRKGSLILTSDRNQ